MRIGYRLRVKQTRTVDIFGEIFNVMDRANFDNPTGDRRWDSSWCPPRYAAAGSRGSSSSAHVWVSKTAAVVDGR